ncbi:MAG: 1,3-beta-galactosyl-N-acetylhexosamine phosphorylase [Erysipelotrichaceae bacterium]|nr:1,3-beta-galactosyl-N-acetylhexosamine phosphorylase [Erysipelotrichaceae bacterium]
MEEKYGRLTLPTDLDIVEETLKLKEQLKADAIRDCDGTLMPEELVNCGAKIYATYYTTRKDNEWAMANPDEVQQEYLITDRYTAFDNELKIELMKGFHTQQLKVNEIDDPKEWWEVIDRTTGEVVNDWDYADGFVTIHNTKKFHVYTVSFLAFLIWDPVHMYNFITNDWKDAPHQMTFDVRQPKTQEYVKNKLRKFCEENKHVDVIRFTTFFHQFTLTFDDKKREKFVEWFGYSASVSPYILRKFEKWAGYKFRPEFIVDQGYHNSTFRPISKEFKDYIEFQQIEVCKLAKELVDIVHSYGKEAMMFLGDHWIGTEPYGKYFETIGLDAVVGSVGNGVTLRMISDIKGIKYTEGRFLPYFFPDVFTEGGDPIKEAKENWLQARRAILRSPLDRIGYGGYLKLAVNWPGFIETITKVIDEFREIHEYSKGSKSYTAPFKVAILNQWGSIRRWMSNQVHHAIWYREIYSYVGVIECLSGMPIDVEFINFDDIKNGIDKDIKVIINAGAAGTSWSGHEAWLDEAVVTTIREWVYNGGGFIGVGEPSAIQHQGRFFQLSDVMGVDKEVGYTMSTDKYNDLNPNHYLLDDINELDFGEGMPGVYATGEDYQVLAMDQKYTQLVVNKYGKGRSIYFAGLPYTVTNCRLLLKALYYVSQNENLLKKYFVSNVYTEIAVFEETRKIAVINNTYDVQKTDLYIENELVSTLELKPMEMRWVDF